MNPSRRTAQHVGTDPFALPRIVVGILDGRYEGAMDYALRAAMQRPAIITMVRPRLDPPLMGVPPVRAEELDGPFGRALVEASADADIMVLEVPDQVVDRLTDPRLMLLRRGAECLVIEVNSVGEVVRAAGPTSGWPDEYVVAVESEKAPVIVAGIDGSEVSEAVVDWANEEAATRGATLRLVVAEAAGTNRLQAQRILRTAREKTSVEIESAVVCGEPVDVLVAQSADADLLVVGGHGTSGLIHSALGGVGDSCARLAECPVVIVPRRRRTSPVHAGTDQKTCVPPPIA